MSFEQELLDDLSRFIKAGDIIVEESSEPFFGRLADEYPLSGSKIDWEQTLSSVVETTSNINDVTEWVKFYEKIVGQKDLKGKVIYVNDSAFECALVLSFDVLSQCIREILEFPEHHFFIGENFNWCMAFTMEGDMAFGYKPKI